MEVALWANRVVLTCSVSPLSSFDEMAALSIVSGVDPAGSVAPGLAVFIDGFFCGTQSASGRTARVHQRAYSSEACVRNEYHRFL